MIVGCPGVAQKVFLQVTGAAYYRVHLRQEEPRCLADWLIHQEITVCRTAVSSFRSLASSLSSEKKFPHLR